MYCIHFLHRCNQNPHTLKIHSHISCFFSHFHSIFIATPCLIQRSICSLQMCFHFSQQHSLAYHFRESQKSIFSIIYYLVKYTPVSTKPAFFQNYWYYILKLLVLLCSLLRIFRIICSKYKNWPIKKTFFYQFSYLPTYLYF